MLTTVTVFRQYKYGICLWQCWLNSKYRPLLVTVNFKIINNKTNSKIVLLNYTKWKKIKHIYLN